MKIFRFEKYQATNCSSIQLKRHRSERRDDLQCIEYCAESVRRGADERHALEQLCRYITRPALANERVQCNTAGQVALKLKTPWRDGTTHLVMSPLAGAHELGQAAQARLRARP